METTKKMKPINPSDPRWWDESHTSAWSRVKMAMERDWEQTKADYSTTHGHELNQSVIDTVKQAVGAEPLPPHNVPNPIPQDQVPVDMRVTLRDFRAVEPALRYGHAAGLYYSQNTTWNDQLEGTLQTEWSSLDQRDGWDVVRHEVKRGFESSRRR